MFGVDVRFRRKLVVLVRRRLACFKAKDFDLKFERREDIAPHLDLSAATRPGPEQKRVNVYLPRWMIEFLEREAKRLRVTRQSIIKMWLAERLEKRTAWREAELAAAAAFARRR